MTYKTDISWDNLREAWFRDAVFAGANEKWDAERAWDHFVEDHS